MEACQTANKQDFDEAYRQLFVLYQDRVFTICLRVTGNQEDALDAAQETMVTLARRIKDFAFRSRFSSWVFRIAVNAAIDSRRKRLDAPRAGVQTTVGNAEGERQLQQVAAEESHADPVQEVSRTENQVLIQDALARMNPRFAALLVLRYIEGMSYDEISEVQECSLGTVKSRLNRAHTALREFLQHRGFDPSELTP
ncbi:MAG: sigma-70 family RNA polymerase sigma factor [Planctomycetota bacterium]|nr:sigma-70 family RNA polymerase sigma factor [Planctomycetota bacterium]